MARPLRIEFAGALYHVMSRGNERKAIVRDDADRKKRLDWLRRTVETYGWRLYAFVVMNNHDQLFVETPEANLSAGMQHLNGSYTSYFNRRHRRVGHLLQGRFRAHLIEEEGYFLEVSRYIHLNPVRVNLVGRPEDYAWSSYPGYCRKGQAVGWVTCEPVLGEFGEDSGQARRAYGRFVRAGVEAPPKSPFAEAVGGLLLGGEAFVDRMRRLLGDRPADPSVPDMKRLQSRPPLDEVLQAVAAHFGYEEPPWSRGRRSDDASRSVAAYLGGRRFGYAAKAVALSY
ncbi:MAG TPA: transposase [Thermoguttaceae bacterium]|nr:transposase [Thermoguttaceae bacterium]